MFAGSIVLFVAIFIVLAAFAISWRIGAVALILLIGLLAFAFVRYGRALTDKPAPAGVSAEQFGP